MILATLLSFSLSILTGALLTQLLWADKNNPINLLFKLSIGIGLGLGISALLYFAYLVLFAGSPYFLYVELILFFTVTTAAALQYKKTPQIPAPRINITALQITLLLITILLSGSSFAGLLNVSRNKAHGAWDAWMIFNRSARFIYRGQEAWQDAFSKDLYVLFHADYPPLLALDIASRWDILNKETTYVPIALGLLFSLASLGLCFSALASFKSLGKGALGLLFLNGVFFFLSEGGRQEADLPLAFYILASVIFLFFHYREKGKGFIVLAAVMAGLAAWTKNEGIFFVFASTGVLFLASFWKRSFHDLLLYFTGLLLPLSLLFYFKFQIAPSSEFLSGGLNVITQKLTDISRHQLIFSAFKNFFLHGGGWYSVGIYMILGAYFLLFQSRIRDKSGAVLIVFTILAIQIMGYYGVYLISPYDLEWHIGYSLNRLFMHIYPAAVFLVLAATQTPETVFSPGQE